MAQVFLMPLFPAYSSERVTVPPVVPVRLLLDTSVTCPLTKKKEAAV